MSTIDKYKLIKKIGEGNFGVVKLGKEKTTGREVAIKVIDKNKICGKNQKTRLLFEKEIIKKFNHINIIKILHIDEDPKKIYFIMEYCEKGELFNYIVKKKKLDEYEASYYFYQLINGLESIHSLGICHRDLKPENLLINSSNILKIIDFGLSTFNTISEPLSSQCGSLFYASPEMITGNKYNGFQVDIWSTGVILFSMISGYLPFYDNKFKLLVQKIINLKIEFPKDISKEAKDLILRLLDVQPDKRITIPKIKNHPFYKKGRSAFIDVHPELLKYVEKNYYKSKGDIVKDNLLTLDDHPKIEEHKMEKKSLPKKSDEMKKINKKTNNKVEEQMSEKKIGNSFKIKEKIKFLSLKGSKMTQKKLFNNNNNKDLNMTSLEFEQKNEKNKKYAYIGNTDFQKKTISIKKEKNEKILHGKKQARKSEHPIINSNILIKIAPENKYINRNFFSNIKYNSVIEDDIDKGIEKIPFHRYETERRNLEPHLQATFNNEQMNDNVLRIHNPYEILFTEYKSVFEDPIEQKLYKSTQKVLTGPISIKKNVKKNNKKFIGLTLDEYRLNKMKASGRHLAILKKNNKNEYPKTILMNKEVYQKTNPINKEIYPKTKQINKEIYQKTNRINKEIYPITNRINKEIYPKTNRINKEIYPKTTPIYEDIYSKTSKTKEELPREFQIDKNETINMNNSSYMGNNTNKKLEKELKLIQTINPTRRTQFNINTDIKYLKRFHTSQNYSKMVKKNNLSQKHSTSETMRKTKFNSIYKKSLLNKINNNLCASNLDNDFFNGTSVENPKIDLRYDSNNSMKLNKKMATKLKYIK